MTVHTVCVPILFVLIPITAMSLSGLAVFVIVFTVFVYVMVVFITVLWILVHAFLSLIPVNVMFWVNDRIMIRVKVSGPLIAMVAISIVAVMITACQKKRYKY